MATEQVIPQDILDDANKIYRPSTIWNNDLNCEDEYFPFSERKAYIQGRLDERNKHQQLIVKTK